MKSMKYPLLLIGIIFAILVLPIVNAETTYTPTTTTVCNEGTCTKTIYSGIEFVEEKGEWKHWTEAKSLKDKGFEIQVLEDDKDYKLEVIDFNATSITVDLNPDGLSIFSNDVPVRIWKVKDENSSQLDFKNTYNKIFEEEIDFWLLNQEERVTYDFGFGDILEFGPNSTSIVLQTANTENLDDTYIEEADSSSVNGALTYLAAQAAGGADEHLLIKFNISSIPNNAIIEGANLSLNNHFNTLDSGEFLDVESHHLYSSFAWDEGTMDWDIKPSSGTNYNATIESTIRHEFGAALTWYNWTVTNMVKTDYGSSENLSIILVGGSTNMEADDGINYRSKEYAGTGVRPKLFITYSIPPEVNITYPINAITYFTNITFFNWTVTNFSTMDTCLYSLNAATNVSVNCLNNGTYITSIEGGNNILFWANDTSGYSNSSTISFTRDFPTPEVNITYPLNISYSSTVTFFNWTILNETFLDTCWYSLNGATNETVTCFDNGTMITSTEGSNNIFLWANNTIDEVGSDNVTYIVDTTFPLLNITYPFDFVDYQKNNTNLAFTWTVSDDTLDTCWYDYDGTNTTVTCGDNTDNIAIINKDNRNITIWVNDSFDKVTYNFTSWDYKVYENSVTYDATSYETDTDTYVLNMSSDNSQPVTAVLHYNNTEYASTKSGDNSEMTFTTELTHEVGLTGSIDFYWNVTHGSDVISTDTNTQTMELIYLSLCNATYPTPFINFTFKDEDDDSDMNATFEIDGTGWQYYLGEDNGIYKELSFDNNTANPSYGFCFSVNETMHSNAVTFRFAETGYPSRLHTTSGDLTNETTLQTLYLLATADGVESAYQVQNTAGGGIQGASIQVERQFSGVWTIIGLDETDSSGTATFFLNPDHVHRLTVTKSGFTTAVISIRPTQSIYTIVLSGGVLEPVYYSDLEAIIWEMAPRYNTVLNPNTDYTFTYNITANSSNLVSYSMELYDEDNTLIDTVSGSTAGGSNITITLNVTTRKNIIGKYFMNIGNGTSQIDLRTWTVLIVEQGDQSILSFLDNIGMSDLDIEQKFTGYFIFFLLLFIGMAGLTRLTGMELSSPGISLGLVLAIAWIASFGNFFTINFTATDFLNQYGIALVVTFLAGGFGLGQLRRT